MITTIMIAAAAGVVGVGLVGLVVFAAGLCSAGVRQELAEAQEKAAKYDKLTDRDEKGRFTNAEKRAAEMAKKAEVHADLRAAVDARAAA